MRIGMTYDLRDYYRSLGFSEEDAAEFDFADTIDAIDNTIKELGFETERIGTITQLVPMLASGKRWDMIFNIAEGVYGIGREAQVPAICDAYKIPYTFSDPCVISLSLNKELTKRVIRDLGLPTPDFMLLKSIDEIDSVRINYPLFAKPYAEGTGKGINAMSIIRDKKALAETCTELLKQFNQPVLIEEYLPGREFTVGIIGSGMSASVAGIMEVILHDNAEKGVYSYTNKENCEDLVTYTMPEDATAIAAGDLALNSWRGLGCLDAGRVDIRCDHNGNPSFIEVNPLAGLHPVHSDLPIICTKAGITFSELIGRIMHSCLTRYGLIDKAPVSLHTYAMHKHAKIPINISAENKLLKTLKPKNSSSKKIVILHQKVDQNASEDEKDVLTQRDEIAQSLEKKGFEISTIEMTLDIEHVTRSLQEIKPWKVFNLVESLNGHDHLMCIAPAVLDSLGLGYTGSATEAIVMASNKITAKRIMQMAGIPTPPCYNINAADAQSKKIKIPAGTYIIKSASVHASASINEKSIFHIKKAISIDSLLKEQRINLKSDYFIELYIDGREFNISILDSPDGPEVMPHAEIIFTNYPEGKPRIVDYRAKWDSDSFEFQNTVRKFDFSAKDKKLLKALEHNAMRCWEVFGLKGYTRVDFRVDENGNPWVLEINANPCLSFDAGFMAAAGRKGLSPDQVVERILGA
jgi:D-alanine-D-alanine ligase